MRGRISVTLTILYFFFNTSILAYPGEVVRAFVAPAQNCTGITFDGKNIWVCDRKTDLIYCLNPENGDISRTISSPAYWPSALAWDGNSICNIDIKGGIPLAEHYHAKIYRVDPIKGNILHFADGPDALATGLASDGEYLWSIIPGQQKIVMINAVDGTTIRSFPSPTGSSSAIAFDGKYLWVVDSGSNKLFMVNPTDGTVIITTQAPSPYVRDIAFDGKNLLAIDSQTDSIYVLKIQDDQQYRLTNKRELNLTFNHCTTNFGPGNVTSLDVHIAIPESRINQKIVSPPVFSPEGYNVVSDNWGQNTVHWKRENIAVSEQFDAAMTVRAETWDLNYFIYPEKVGGFQDIPETLKNLYLADNEKFQLTGNTIQNAVNEAIGNEKNLYYQARKIYRYVQTHMYYEMAGGWNTAPEVLERGNGSCSEYSFVYIAMCRAAGIPARYVGAVSVRLETAQLDDVFHRWVEIYLPNYGWIPVDPSGGDSDSPAHQAAYFGAVKGKYIVTTQSGGGSETLEWTYNANEFIKTEPKTFVVSEHIGNWDVIK